ncbi:MAG TPA: PKD domain-containing protein [Vicinamibacterales bacterium]|jgi:PKD repeat protein
MMVHRFRLLQRPRMTLIALAILAGVFVAGAPRISGQAGTTGWKVVAWNNLGMHCMDADFSVFAILPPYNTIQAQVIDAAGNLVTSQAGVNLSYQGIADPTGSINTTSAGKTNFWSFVAPMFGVTLPADVGLLNHNMPGLANTAQPMVFDPAFNWFIAEGIPITPYDNAGAKNPYPLMKVTASDAAGAPLASTNIVLPVSDEMDCSACHSSASGPAARPRAGWVNLADAQRDYRFNILRLHDDRQLGNPAFLSALAAKGYRSTGLEATASGGRAILCAACHKSEALVGSGMTGIPPLTTAVHALHARVVDPTNNFTLDSSSNRSACYRCHPGSVTRCLRGVMGNSVAADGTMAIQCQNCHGPLSAVGNPNRTGWFQEPTCQNCHTGTAVSNSGQIRFTSAFGSTGLPRAAADPTFATVANAPAAGLSLYRFSAGHGGLQCSACHGSTHAEYPSAHPNDNLQSVALQGHVGTIAECTACHQTTPTTTNGGPHGMHAVGQVWISGHPDAVNNGGQCQACHGADYRGTVLSRAFGPRTLTTSFGTKTLFRGAQVSCYMCHNGPGGGDSNPNRPPVAGNLSASTSVGAAVAIPLAATDPDGNALTLRIVSQPTNGTVGLSGTVATYFPYVGFSGADTFTYAAWDGSIDSNLATVTVQVGSGTGGCSVATTASAPGTAAAGVAVSFTGSATTSGCTGTLTYAWNFGDGSALSTAQSPTHVYAIAGPYTWTMTASDGGVSSAKTGTIVVSASAPACSLTTTASAPATATVLSPVSFGATATATNCTGTVAYDWDFGDGAAHSTSRSPSHTYSSARTFQWTMTASVARVSSAKRGSIVVTSTADSAPQISTVTALSDPFRIRIDGANFQPGVRVFIGGSTVASADVHRVSSTRIDLSGEGVSSRFPRATPVSIRVVNPDGRSATTSFAR